MKRKKIYGIFMLVAIAVFLFAGRLLRGLTAKARRVVVLRHLGEYSNREVAELTGETEEAVRQQLSRARRQMRRMLDDEHNF